MERKIYEKEENINDNVVDDNDDNNSKEDYDTYIKKNFIFKNLNNSLKQLLDISIDNNTTLITDWKPPTKPGLDNSEQIVQNYFINKEIKYTEILKDNIRNMRPLSEEEIKYIITLNEKDLYDVINTFNKVNQALVEIIYS
jgi:hypothetical protein